MDVFRAPRKRLDKEVLSGSMSKIKSLRSTTIFRAPGLQNPCLRALSLKPRGLIESTHSKRRAS